MKYIFSLLLLIPILSFGQYTGGVNDGYAEQLITQYFEPGVIASDQEIEPDETPSDLSSVSDASGMGTLTYQWEYSGDGISYAEYAGMVGTTLPISLLNWKGLMVEGKGYELWARRRINTSKGDLLYSNAISVKVVSYTFDNASNDLDWNNVANWTKNPYNTNVLPISGNSVRIEMTNSAGTSPTISSNTYANITVVGSNKLTIPSGEEIKATYDFVNLGDVELLGALTVDGSLNNTGILTVKSISSTKTGSLISNGTLSDGIYNIERYIDDAKTWQLVSSPMEAEFSGKFYGHYLNEYIFNDGDFKAIKSTIRQLGVGEGLVTKKDGALAGSVDNPIVFSTSKPNTDQVPIAIKKGGAGNTFFGLTGDFNFVGNPYPSNLDWKKIYADNSGLVTKYLYYYIDGGASTLPLKNGWKVYDATSADASEQYISIGQGFGVVCTTEGNLLLKNTHRSHLAGNGFNKKSSVNSNYLELICSTDDYVDKSYFKFNENATVNFDYDYDAYKFNSFAESPNVSFLSADDRSMSICEMPEAESVAIGFNMLVSGDVTFSVSNTGDYSQLIIEDINEGKFIDLLKENYTFQYSIDEASEGRFVLHFNREILNENEPSVNINIYNRSNTIIIDSDENLIDATLVIYNISGQIVFSKQYSKINHTEVSTDLSEGVFLLELVSNNGILTKKIAVKNTGI